MRRFPNPTFMTDPDPLNLYEMEKIKAKHVCHKCPYEASRPSKLKRHIDGVHDKIKSHACDVRGLAFIEKAKLKRHQKGVHLKIRDHACTQCRATFLELGHLKTHIKYLHNHVEKIFVCEDCGSSFSLETSLRSHKQSVHDKVRSHICLICKVGFTSKTKLNQQSI